MNDLITAAKTVIDWLEGDYPSELHRDRLIAAVERAENPPADYSEWTAKNSGKVLSAHEVWTAAQQADRNRIRSRAKLASEKTWKAGDWYVGPQHNMIEKFVDSLLEDGDDE